MADETGRQAGGKQELKGRAHQLLAYLEALHRLRHPVELNAIPSEALFLPSLPAHPAIEVKPSDEILVAAAKLEKPDLLAVPADLSPYIRWDDPAIKPRLEPDAPVDAVGEGYYDAWIADTWQPWWDSIQPTLEARRVFPDLYDRRLTAERDVATHELVWVRGVAMSRSAAGETIRLPLFVRPARFDFDDRGGRMVVAPTGPPVLELDAFERVTDSFDLLKRIETELVAEAPSEDEAEEAEAGPELDQADVLARVARALPEARLVESATALPTATDAWQVVDIEGFYLRRRPVQYEAFFKSLSASLEDDYLPDTWSAILSDEPTEAPLSDRPASPGATGWDALDQRILSPLPLNERQADILGRLARTAGVTVQGPPGTGKSYAIAALTSHFLAHGLRVLICSEKPHPLGVVRDKLPENLRDLCVAILGDDRASKRQLEDSVGAITGRVNSIDPQRERKRLAELDDQLDAARRRLAEARNNELEVRAAEQSRIELPTGEFSVAEAARWIADRPDDGWIDDRLAPSDDLPLDDAELDELVSLTSTLSASDRQRHGPRLADAKFLIAGEALAGAWQQLDSTSGRIDAVAGYLNVNSLAALGQTEFDGLSTRVDRHRSLVEWATSTAWAPILHEVRSSPDQRSRWTALIGQLDAAASEAAALSAHLSAHQVEIPVAIDGEDVRPTLAELHERFASGKGLPRLGGGNLKQLVEAARVDGRRPTTAQDTELLGRALELARLRQRLANLWAHEFQRFGFSALEPDRPEADYQTNSQGGLRQILDLPAASDSLASELAPHLRFEPQTTTVEHLDQVRGWLAEVGLEFERHLLEQEFAEMSAFLTEHAPSGHATVRELQEAYLQRDPGRWDLAADESRRLAALAEHLDRHTQLCERLAAVAPGAAAQFKSGEPRYDAAAIRKAWSWRQLRGWVDSIVGLGDLAEISGRIAEAEREEHRLLGDLVEQRSWLAMAERTTGKQRSALETWAQAMRRVGKGTGKHAPRHRRTAMKAMQSAQDAVPVWIMSIAQAIDSFRPGEASAFDVVIIDEASQAGLDALAVLSLGQRVLVVGDDKQVSPTSFVDEDEAARLQRTHLEGVPDSEGFDVTTSLYDTASRRFPGVIQLQEHFRCLPEIIAFSNDLSYAGMIEPLREHHPDPDWQPVRSVFVDDGYREGQLNRPEVDRVVGLVEEIIADERYGRPAYPSGASIGIIAMMGTAQAKEIESRLIDRIPIEEQERRRLRVGNAAEFQGDERDVMILSMVDSVNETGRATGATATRKSIEQRFNVAASRARDQLIVVHSFPPGIMNESDLRRRLVAFAMDPGRIQEETGDLKDGCESKFERDVLHRLLGLGLHLKGQYPVAGYRIDFTATDLHGRRVAIECDGDRYHGIDQLKADSDRQRRLERLGWRFVRVRASEFYNDPDRQLERMVDRMNDFGLDVSHGSGGV